MSDPDFQLLTTKEAAKLLACSVAWLILLRKEGRGPPYMQLGERSLRYNKDDLQTWAREAKHAP